MFDFLVVGGGPAGAAAGMRLAQAGARVIVVEATSYDLDRFGETLPPEINPVLRELGVFEGVAGVATAATGIVSVWGSDVPTEQDFVRNPHGEGWRVDRNAFDAMLLDAARRAGAVCATGRKAAPVRSEGVWRSGEIAARFLIDASGRNSGEREVDDAMVAVALRLSRGSVGKGDSRTYIEAVPGGWWYSGVLPDGRLIAMFFTDPETYSEEGVVVGERLEAAPLTRARLRGARLEGSRVLHVSSSCRRTLCGEGWAAAGDSASSFDPLSGRGIFKALRQGAAAAKAALDGTWAEYVESVRAEFDAYVVQRRSYYASERRWPEAGFWTRRLRTVR